MNGDITVADAQRDGRTTFLGGFPGANGLRRVVASVCRIDDLGLAAFGVFLVLGLIMCAVALVVGTSTPAFGIGVGWFTGAVLIIFAFIGRRIADAADVLPTASAA